MTTWRRALWGAVTAAAAVIWWGWQITHPAASSNLGYVAEGVGGVVIVPALAILFADVWSQRRSKRVRTARKHWIPLAMVPFRLVDEPRITHLPGAFPKSAVPHFLVLGVRGQPRPNLKGFDPGIAAARNKFGDDMIACEVDWDQGLFGWKWQRETPHVATIGFSISPMALDSKIPLDLVTEETWAKLKAKAQFAFNRLWDGPNQAIDAGILRVWARLGSATADFDHIPADSWRHYRITDWATGRAEAPGSPPLFSTCFELSAGTAPVRKRIIAFFDRFGTETTAAQA